MRLLEIVRGRQTSPGRSWRPRWPWRRRSARLGVVVGNCRGFVGNRMFGPYMREAQFLVEEGARVEHVDAALVDFGMAMGPAGRRRPGRARRRLADPQGIPPPDTAGRPPTLVADLLCESGHYGQKTGSGLVQVSPREPATQCPTPRSKA